MPELWSRSLSFSGNLNSGQVVIQKHYLGQHALAYIGEYDGEGTMRGKWQIFGGWGGDWMIKIVASVTRDEEAIDAIPEWQPG